MAEKAISLFEVLSQINVSQYAEKKGQFTYLSWAWAVNELKKVSPEAYWIIHEWGIEGSQQPYQQTEAGCFVKVTVIAEDIEMTQGHPVLDHSNNTVKQPNAFEVNTSIMRCLTKAISLHGLGLYIYAGEDLPEVEGQPTKSKPVSGNGVKDKVYTGHKPDMKSGGDPKTDAQVKYIMSLRSSYLTDFGEDDGKEALDKLEKSFFKSRDENGKTIKSMENEALPSSVKDMTKQEASNYINGLLQEHASLIDSQ